MYPAVARIFVSSTWIDLQPERQAVEDAVNRMTSGKFIGMEYFGSRPDSTEGASLKEVDRSDIYVGIIGGRYGSGITEAEYRRAIERKIPCFIYFKDQSAISQEFLETDADKAERLAVFKNELFGRHIITTPFKTPQELAAGVRDDLHRWFFDKHLAEKLASEAAGNIVTQREDERIFRLDSGSDHGSVLDRGTRPQVKLRPTPLRPNVRPFSNLLDRTSEAETSLKALKDMQPAQIYGQEGIGKTALLRHIAHNVPKGDFPDGTIFHHQVGNQTSADLLQFIFDSCYQSDPSYKPRDAELLNLLRDRKTLILMDDVETARSEIEDLINAVPGSSFLISGKERLLFGEGHTLMLEGLPDNDAIELLERVTGHELNEEEKQLAASICSTLNGHPLSIAQVGAIVQEGKARLSEIANTLQSAQHPDQTLGREISESLSYEERKLLSILSIFGGASVQAENLSAMSGIQNTQPALENLSRRNVVELTAFGWRIVNPVKEIPQSQSETDNLKRQAIAHFSAWAEQNRNNRARITNSSPALMACLDWADETGIEAEGIKIGMAMEPALEQNGGWDAAQSLLEKINRLAVKSGDTPSQAWILHQQGTLELCKGNDDAAGNLLTEALETRINLGDHVAASVTRHNLDFLRPLPVAPGPKQSIPGKDRPLGKTAGRVPAWAKFTLLAVLSGGAILGGKAVYDNFIADGTSQVSFSPEELDFGRQFISDEGILQDAIVTNDQDQPISIADIALSGAEADSFSIIDSPCIGATLAPNDRCSIVASFNPRREGSHTAKISIINDASTVIGSIGLKGEAISADRTEPSPTEEPGTTDEGPGLPAVAGINLSNRSLNFGRIEAGTSDFRDLTIVNDGSAPLEINSTKIIDNETGIFEIEDNYCLSGSIPPNRNCLIRVAFSPRETGLKTAELRVVSNAPDSTQSVQLRGEGFTIPTPTPETPSRPDIRPRQVDFGVVQVGQGSREGISVSNPGTAPLTIQAASLRGQNADEFNFNDRGCRNVELIRGRQCTITVAFIPKTPGIKFAELLVRNNSARGEESVQLRGTGFSPARDPGIPPDNLRPGQPQPPPPEKPEPRLSVNPTRVDFGDQQFRSRVKPIFVTFRNTGTGTLRFDNINIKGADENSFRISSNDCHNARLESNSQCSVEIAFLPIDPGRKSSNLVFSSNAVSGPGRVPLTGNVLVPTRRLLTIKPTDLDFSNVEVGTKSATRSIAVANSGNERVTLRRPELSGSDEDEFNLRGNCPASLDPGRQCELGVTFIPEKEGRKSARVEIRSDAENDRIRINLSGNAVSSRREPVGWCCVSGKVGQMTRTQCLQRKGDFYDDEKTARARCRIVKPPPSDRVPPPTPNPRSPGTNSQQKPQYINTCAKLSLGWNSVNDPSSPVKYNVVVQVQPAGSRSWRVILNRSTTQTAYPAFPNSSAIRTNVLYRWNVQAEDAAGNPSKFSPFLYFSCTPVVK